MKEEEKIEFLKSIELFSSLTDDELREITTNLTIKKFRKGQTILYEEDTNEYMYIIFEGEVKVIQTTEEGKEIILAMHGSGDFFGEISLLDGKTIPARVLAIKDSITAIISKKGFYSLLGHNKVAIKMSQILCSRLRESWAKVQMLNFNNASQRVKMLLIMLSDKYGIKSDEGIILKIKLTHQDLAEMSGMTRETVTRVIDKLQKSGEIAILRNKVIRLTPDFCKEFKSAI
ncbi:transcriptional regulator, Crp/Fnr family [hydrothermal vent metagenome]|uniref:Transcriptional regulator, Crp/Fnr family n=1 Tax=hydrothermal vent metagenome TaxID=652676 RepID=A0A3B1DFC9_9ZZZZ